MQDASVKVTHVHLACLHRKTMEKQRIGMKKCVLCEQPTVKLYSGFRPIRPLFSLHQGMNTQYSISKYVKTMEQQEK